ncbi:cAMP-binding protein [uncultured Desulfatiglans sp.]|nr:cAMP-binding protein [uncultured Desulfatiglans sp.]
METPAAELTRTVGDIPMFEGLPARQLEELAQIVRIDVFEKGGVIFSEGDPGLGFYVLVEGRVKIYKISWDGKEQILHIFGPGEPFGEVPVFAGQRFPAHAEAIEKSTLLFFPREAFINCIRRNPDLALDMLAVLARRLRVFTVLIEDLSLKEVPGRLAAYLLYLSRRSQGSLDLELDISKSQLAALLGTIPETLSRILGRMSKRGLILSNGPRIEILDLAALQQLAESGTGL